MKLIVGLGNPGPSYLMTRHNIGFMAVDSLVKNSFTPIRLENSDSYKKEAPKKLKPNQYKKTQKSLVQKITLKGQNILFAKPQTYMNLSGEAVKDLMNFYKIPLQDLLVIQDDVDQDFLSLKFQKNRGSGGHRGIESIHLHLRTPNYTRLKLGVGRPGHTSASNFNTDEKESAFEYKMQSTSNYVLSPFTKIEQSSLKDFLQTSGEAVLYFIKNGFEKSAGKFNGKPI